MYNFLIPSGTPPGYTPQTLFVQFVGENSGFNNGVCTNCTTLFTGSPTYTLDIDPSTGCSWFTTVETEGGGDCATWTIRYTYGTDFHIISDSGGCAGIWTPVTSEDGNCIYDGFTCNFATDSLPPCCSVSGEMDPVTISAGFSYC